MAIFVALVASAAGCLHLRDNPENIRGLGVPHLVLPHPSMGGAGAGGSLWGVAVGALALGGLGLGWRRWRRACREAGQGVPLDREDLALLRTARDAIGFLVHKQMGRLKVVSLAWHRQRRGQ